MLPPFHGEALKRWTDTIAEIAHERARHVAARHAAQGAAADAGDHARGDPARDLRQPRPGAQATRSAHALDMTGSTPNLIAMSLVKARPVHGGSLARRRAHRRADLRRASTSAGDGDSILDLLKHAGATREELRDQLVTLLAAGHETTATALAWALRAARAPPDGRSTPTSRSTRSSRRSCAPAPCSQHHRPQDAAAVHARRLHAPGGRLRRRLHLSRAPPAADAHVHPVRRRHAPLPRCRVRHAGDARGAASGRPHGSHSRPTRHEGERMRRRSVTLAPSRGALDHPDDPLA